MYPKPYDTIYLPYFKGGALKVTLWNPVSEAYKGTEIITQGPGAIASSGEAGPKDWSPLGLVPKDWIRLMEHDSRGTPLRVLAAYQADYGSYTTDTAIFVPANTKSALYFVPVYEVKKEKWLEGEGVAW